MHTQVNTHAHAHTQAYTQAHAHAHTYIHTYKLQNQFSIYAHTSSTALNNTQTTAATSSDSEYKKPSYVHMYVLK